MRLCTLLLITLLSATPAMAGDGGAEIWYLRHAETLGNVTHDHSGNNDRTFSHKGKQQAKALTGKLDRMHFDRIIVSPKERAIMTVRPYMQKHGLKAEVWQELAECCWQKDRSSAEYRRGIQMVYSAAGKIRSRFAGSHQRILIVGHYHSGSRLVEVLQGREPKGRYKLSNTGMLHLVESGDGYFKLVD